MDYLTRMVATTAGSREKIYVEDVFSTTLYTGNGTNNLGINTGIPNLSEKGGLLWFKQRNTSPRSHKIYDTERMSFGAGFKLASPVLSTDLAGIDNSGGNCFVYNNSPTGYVEISSGTPNELNIPGVLWTFRKAPKFFDVVTYTGNGTETQAVSHSLGTAPGLIIVKAFDVAEEKAWVVYHRSLGYTQRLILNTTSIAQTTDGTLGYAWSTTGEPTATTFYVGDTFGSPSTSELGVRYVAYLFAHNAGGFGDSGTDNVISCGSVFSSTVGTPVPVNLGFEPQWILIKQTSGGSGDLFGWYIVDVARGLSGISSSGTNPAVRHLFAHSAGAETEGYSIASINSTGFSLAAQDSTSSNQSFIYVAIRRPMKAPKTSASVFAASKRIGTGSPGSSTALGNTTDLVLNKLRIDGQDLTWTDRVRGAKLGLFSNATTAESSVVNDVTGFDSMSGFNFGSGAGGRINASTYPYIDYLFRRAPGFFDIITYVGTGSAGLNQPHNLKVRPELIFYKQRTNSSEWYVSYAPNQSSTGWIRLRLNTNEGDTAWSALGFSYLSTDTHVYTEQFASIGTAYSGSSHVAYLFASSPGISKIGTYTGNGGTQTIPCDFGTKSCAFIIIKRTNSTGDWYVWDSTRGIISANDPRFSLNSTLGEVTTDDSVDQVVGGGGFVVNQVASSNINVNGGTYLFFAISGSEYDPNAGDALYTTPGTYSWTAPDGVTSVSVLCVGAGGTGGGVNVNLNNGFWQGGGGGGGGGLAYLNNYSVTPGNSYTVVVAAGGSSNSTYFVSTSTVGANAGTNGSNGFPAGGGYGYGGAGGAGTGTTSIKYSGGNGGNGVQGANDSSNAWNGGGGGAAGYAGNGGNGGSDTAQATGAAGSGGGGGGGQVNYNTGAQSGGGGGVGLYGQGTNGVGGGGGYVQGGGGSDGTGGGFNVITGGAYGGGGGAGAGANGAVRIMWGTGRIFPNNANGI